MSRLPGRCASLCLAGVILMLPYRATAQGNGYTPLRRDGNGVPALGRTVTLTSRSLALDDALRQIRNQAGLGLVYKADLPGLDSRVVLADSLGTAATLLLDVLDGSRLQVLVSASGQAVLVERAVPLRSVDTLRGRVVESTTLDPVSEAEVGIEGTGTRVWTDRDGRFLITRIPEGEFTIVVTRIGYAGRRMKQSGGGTLEAAIELQPAPTPLAAVIVTPGTFGVLEETTTAKRSLTRSEIEATPQVGEDPFRAIARLPGVVGHDLTASFGVRGSAGREVLLRLDGVQLIEPFHLKDFDSAISIVDIDAVGGVELMTGGFGAQYGDRTAGVFDMRTMTAAPGPVRTTLGLSLTNLRAASSGTFANDRADWLVSARRGYIDLALRLGGSDDRISPTYYDVLGKVEYRPGPASRIAVNALFAGDQLTWHDAADEPDIDSRYGSAYAWLSYDAGIGRQLSSRSVASIGHVTWNRIGMQELDDHESGLDVVDDRTYDYVGLRQELQLQTASSLLLRGGVDVQARRAAYDYDGYSRRYNVLNGMLQIDSSHTTVTAEPDETWAGAWISARYRPVAPLTVEAGARFDHHSHTGDDDFAPRVSAALTIGPRTVLRAGWGLYYQSEGLHELQVQDGISAFQPAIRAEHRVAGIEHDFGGIDGRIDAYDRITTGRHDRYINLTDNADLFPELSATRVLAHFDGGSARGIEFLVRRRARVGFGWSASWAVARVRDVVNGRTVPGTRDQRHALGGDVSYTATGRWRFSAAWQYHSGWPWTPTSVRADTIVNAIWTTREYGDYNASTLPAYHRLDVRASREISTRKGRILMFIDIMNFYGRGNARNVVPFLYNPTGRGYRIGYSTDTLLPRLPSFGIQWQF